ncbi:hypothetical protein [Jannaschia aquimarina]|uniref:Uncharacterized protein n=1 Tax=Jannaschia aquimarina TaxID=935700 RepID=A0A0D1EK90_9RHOB|nr:hypothetical protein [Jannaschia aquimarina]KIT17426.1 hypothetical protein jaqu_08410 [Jannaschia aquimarina]SNT24011.1 hypothetical protein SAMN05421775_108161 [Jannaschia aquimarina]
MDGTMQAGASERGEPELTTGQGRYVMAFYKGEGERADKITRLLERLSLSKKPLSTEPTYTHCELVAASAPVEDGGRAWAISASDRDGAVRKKVITFKAGHWDFVPLPHAPADAWQRAEAHLGKAPDRHAMWKSLFKPLRRKAKDSWFSAELCAHALDLQLAKAPSPTELYGLLVNMARAPRFLRGSYYMAFYKGRGEWKDTVTRLMTVAQFAVIRKASRSHYTHCELVAAAGIPDDGEVAWSVSSSGRDKGVRVKPIAFKKENWDFVPLPFADYDAWDLAVEHAGKPYDYKAMWLSHLFAFNREDPEKWFCSEICAHALRIEMPNALSPGGLFRRIERMREDDDDDTDRRGW